MNPYTLIEINRKKPTHSELAALYFNGYKIMKSGSKRSIVVCRCKCGNIIETLSIYVVFGKRISCGCLRGSVNQTNGLSNKAHSSKIYNLWHNIKTRCYKPNSKYYHRYGGRGIKMYGEWKNNFTLFYEWCISNGWSDNLQIDRRNNNGNYTPNNCRFVSALQNKRNKENTIRIKYKGYNLTMREWEEKIGIKYYTIRSRYIKKWKPKDILNNKLMKPHEYSSRNI